MSDHGATDDDYYAILGIPVTADSKAIRKAYLKQSLKFHPDKNLDDPNRSKREFVRIGEAYEVLSDPVRREAYDKYRRGGGLFGGFRPNTSSTEASSGTSYHHHESSSHTTDNYQREEQQYHSYREAFDATMAGLSEDELRDVMGAAALIGSIVGSIAGSRMMRNSNNAFIRTAGAVLGSQVASRAATSIVATAHQQSKERALLDCERRERVARGEEPEPIPASQAWKDLANATKSTVRQTAKILKKGLEASNKQTS